MILGPVIRKHMVRDVIRTMHRLGAYHYELMKWLRAGLRSGEFERRIEYHAQLALHMPELYTMVERDEIFLEHNRTESFLAIGKGLVTYGAARELMGANVWCALRFCPEKIPTWRMAAYAAKEPWMAKNYAGYSE